MKITLVLKESIFDCKVRITDSYGERYYDISCLCEEGTNCSSIEAEIFDSEFSLLLIPVMPDTLSILNEFEPKDWKEKFAKKTTGFLMNSLCKMLLHVACNYHIVGLQDGDRLDITLQSYAFGKIDRFNVLGLVPMIYLFFEVANFNDFYKLTDAYETNRKDVLNFARTLAFTEVLGNGLFLTLFIYPIQVSRIKRLTKNKKLLKVLTKFNSLSNTERQIFLEKQERFFDRY